MYPETAPPIQPTGPETQFRVVLFYIYTPIDQPEVYRDEHHRFCLEHNLLGRVIIAEEGLNGSVSGLAADCAAYMAWLYADPRFAAIDFKIESSEKPAFQKLHVRVKTEIVNSDLPVDPLIRTGIHLEPAAFKMMKNNPDVVLVDMRSRYEHEVGKFKSAITFEMDNLRELPEHVQEIEHLKDKKIITYCTGGVKCEKASAYLLEQGFQNVYQLHGGIIKYGLEEGGEDFDGACYVFDNRVTTEVNRVNPSTVAHCHLCNTPTNRMVNCANPECNDHLPICAACGWTLEGSCSTDCREHPRKRHYDGTGYYPRETNGYTPLLGYRSQAKEKFSLKTGA
ncbi:MAG: rhodanese-related sulfurtransferase [Cytophagaceae bacterium]|nr:rhodanese-related sulfurtransferase [Cytophagaceae bacterium]